MLEVDKENPREVKALSPRASSNHQPSSLHILASKEERVALCFCPQPLPRLAAVLLELFREGGALSQPVTCTLNGFNWGDALVERVREREIGRERERGLHLPLL